MRTAPALVVLAFFAAVTRVPAADLKLFEAVQKRDQKAVLALIKNGSDVNAQRSDGSTALIWAASRDDAEIETALLRAGAKINVAEENGETALLAACTNGNLAIARALLDA
jgi:ankyrin repeat protein